MKLSPFASASDVRSTLVEQYKMVCPDPLLKASQQQLRLAFYALITSHVFLILSIHWVEACW